MGRSRNRKPLFEGVEIIDVAAEGKALAKIDEKVLFVQNAVPGDIVDVQVNKKRKNFYEGYVTQYHKYSDIRVEPFCEHFGTCGGCKWQALPYSQQLVYKQREVENNLKRIGKVDLPEVQTILASKKDQFYRNKLEFTFSNKRWLANSEMEIAEDSKDRYGLGFHVPRMFDKVIDVKKCYLQDEPSNSIRLAIKAYALENGLTFFDIRNHEGFLRTLIIRTTSTGEVMVIVSFYHEDVEKREGLLNHLNKKFPEITSLLYVINSKANDTIGDQDIICFKGKEFIEEEMEGLKFRIGPKSFYQTNSEQAYELYKVTRAFADLSGDEVVYDLYTGTGTIANFVASKAKKVVGIEYVPEAIEDAKINSENNSITNTVFYAGDMKDILNEEFIKTNGQPDVMIVDPPRAGMHEDVVKTILKTNVPKIVYVSCNSATQARDLNLLDEKYKVEKIQPVDMFPHTHHVENVVLLSIK
ncbi:23S rRNA (uracil(1939)-C(5))-methyltransferase RlmD [Plebeiibacterium sediminum]|uniref:23S rRNA (Uracil(1939)-C(5))-methyltransferase RlmD n=1 Tax=Plebeiibacterium sediminum TaxID=2992112 RepID=A0AAE3SE81_9BACT|nr:23S rRNA (uracil(1939)-C(5))-methyltransferase RlmD [Plebeiobacterium sediminum]MCW3785732.1 23S rRNA (uracil(1939)-C(5))-methyltransferase RlmD [Plebeiobacterium sediminum]